MLYLFVRKWQVAVSNSSRVNLHLARLARLRANPASFQTPAERIYTALEILFFQAMNIEVYILTP